MPARLLFDSFSNNTGDAAIGIANRQLLEARGVETLTCDPFAVEWKDGSPLLIGGGELLRRAGTPFYDAFRVPGEHILHASGVWTDADQLGFADRFVAVSARSTVEANVLRNAGIDASVLPCSTTCLERPDFDFPELPLDEPLVGIHLVPHALREIDYLVAMINEIPYRKVFFSFTPYNSDLQFMRSLPLDVPEAIYLDGLSPLALHALIARFRFVMVSSLHASIFAFSQNVPFVSIAQKKVKYYFADRGLDRFIVGDLESAQAALDEVQNDPPDFSTLVAKDKEEVHSAFDRYASIYRQAAVDPGGALYSGPSAGVTAEQMEAEHWEHVIRDRDSTIGLQTLRLAVLDENYRQALERMDSLQEASAEAEAASKLLKDRLDEIEPLLNELRQRPLRTAAAHLRRRLAAKFERSRG